jgi:drug/metabolite transporter (DMT)-like permease
MSNMKRPPVPPVLVLALGILAVSAASIFIRYAQKEAHSLVIAAWRLSLATLVLAPFALTRRREELASLKHSDLGLALLSGVFLAVHFATWISSLAYTSVASSVVLVSTAPLWVALLSPITLKEPLARPVLLGMMLALVGGTVVSVSDTCTWSGAGFACPWAGILGRFTGIGGRLDGSRLPDHRTAAASACVPAELCFRCLWDGGVGAGCSGAFCGAAAIRIFSPHLFDVDWPGVAAPAAGTYFL